MVFQEETESNPRYGVYFTYYLAVAGGVAFSRDNFQINHLHTTIKSGYMPDRDWIQKYRTQLFYKVKLLKINNIVTNNNNNNMKMTIGLALHDQLN